MADDKHPARLPAPPHPVGHEKVPASSRIKTTKRAKTGGLEDMVAENNRLRLRLDALKAENAHQEATLKRAGIECGCGAHHWVCHPCVLVPMEKKVERLERDWLHQMAWKTEAQGERDDLLTANDGIQSVLQFMLTNRIEVWKNPNGENFLASGVNASECFRGDTPELALDASIRDALGLDE